MKVYDKIYVYIYKHNNFSLVKSKSIYNEVKFTKS